jgi:anaerobic ribonucleoside-triphosphate reductase activating protein
MTRININKVHFPVTSLGYGKRIGIWTQGCSIHCPGCISKDTWEFRNDTSIGIADFLSSLSPWLECADGVTISGGEPFDQPESLAALATALRHCQSRDILVYSGYPREKLFEKYPEVLRNIDVLISEPYRPDAGANLTLRGSDNQRITLLTDLARSRYPLDVDRSLWGERRRLDLMVEGETVWLAGIPRPDEMAAIQRRLAEQGLACESSEQSTTIRVRA